MGTALAFPTLGWSVLAWVGLVPWLVALEGGGARRALGVCVAWSLCFWIVMWDWGPSAVAGYFEQSVAVGVGFLLATWGLLLLPWVAGYAGVHRALARRFDAALPLLSAAAWVGWDLARVRLFTGSDLLIGNPWGVLGYSQVDWILGIQVASLAGVYGIDAALLACNVALARLLRPGSGGPRRRLALAASGLAPLGVLVAWGAWSLGQDPAEERAPVAVAVVQGNLAGSSRWRSDLYGRNLDTYLTLTHAAAAEGRVDIVFWPEAAMTFFVDEERGYRVAIARALAGAELVAGSPRRSRASPPRHFNSVFRITPDGEVAGVYDKQLLLPFAEFTPLGRLDLVRRDFGGIREFRPGGRAAPVPTRAGPAGILVCNEVMFPGLARRQVAAGARYLVNPANDGWVGDRQYSEQMFQIARLRAVEQGRWLVRPSTAGPSAIVDDRGRVRGRLEPFTRDTLLGALEPRERTTVYARVGDAFAWACVAVSGGALAWARRGRRDPGP